MATFTDTINPSAGVKAPEAVPVSSPEELQARVSGWETFLHRLQTDPVMQRAALHTATQLAQGPGYGQSTLGHLAQSLEGGVQAYDIGRSNQAAEQAKAQQTSFTQALQTAQEKRAAELQPSTIRANEASARLHEVQAEQAPGQADLGKRKTLAEINKLQQPARNAALEAKTIWEDTYKVSTEGRKRTGESEEDYKARVADAWLKHGQKSTVGSVVQAANAVLNDFNSTEEEKAAARQALMQALQGSTDQGKPAAPERALSKSGKPIVKINGQWVYE